jgi:hypothetical protein
MPIRGSIHDGRVPWPPGGAVVDVVTGVAVWSVAVTTGVGDWLITWAGVAVTRGEVTVMYPGTVVVLRPPEFTAVRLTEKVPLVV